MAASSVTFSGTIKPYFTQCYHDHMTFMMDLWDPNDVQSNFDLISEAVGNGSMPKAGCPEGVWTKAQAQQFLTVFNEWKDAGFPP